MRFAEFGCASIYCAFGTVCAIIYGIETNKFMTNLSYIFQNMRHSLLLTIIKVLSIGLGLAMSGLLLVRVAYDNGIDRCFGDTDNLYQVWMSFEVDGNDLGAQEMCVGALAGGILNEIPDMVEYSAIQRSYGSGTLTLGDITIDGEWLIADSLFFNTMGVEILEGQPMQLAMPGYVYLGDNVADAILAGESPVGATVTDADGNSYTVAGIYRNWGSEATVKGDMIFSMPTFVSSERFQGWRGGDSWFTYIRVKEGTNPDLLNNRIHQVIKANAPDTESVKVDAWAAPLRDTYRNYDKVKQITLTLTLLAIGIIIVTALNYVLLSISSLPRRAKAVGVLKCSGATSGSIMRMFLIETVVIVLLGVIVAAILIRLGNSLAADSIGSYFTEYINMNRLWVIVAVVVLVFLLSALIPSVVFSRVPVQHVFRRFSGNQHAWKYTLLFIEFAGVALVAGILNIVSAQYDCLINSPLGFNHEGVVVLSNHTRNNSQTLVAEDNYRKLPYVESVTASGGFPMIGYSGAFVRDEQGKVKFSTRFDEWRPNYADVMGMTLIDGRMPLPDTEGQVEVVVNEEFAKEMGWRKGTEIGRRFKYDLGNAEVVGVVADFRTQNYYHPMQPFVANTTNNYLWRFSVKLKEPYAKNYHKLLEDLEEMYPADGIYSFMLSEQYDKMYVDVKLFRTMVGIAVVIMIFISAIGLTGYLTDEMRRRSREIAIRKVNGASTGSIIDLITRSILLVAVPAVAVGTLAAILLGRSWLEQFSVTVSGVNARFILAGLLTLIFITLLAVVFTRLRANENPTQSLRSE